MRLELKDHNLNIRVTLSDLEQWRKAARVKKLTLSSFVVRVLNSISESINKVRT